LDPVKQRIVAFVDLGHSKTTITIAAFIKGKTKIICHKSDRNLGARDFDWEVLKLISAEFAKKFGDNPMESPRCVIRMLDAIEKARQMLSSVPDAQLNIDYLLNEEDLVRTLKKDEFEKLINPFIIRFQELIKRTISASGLNVMDIHSVEMIGDATRTPKILEVTKSLFKKPETVRTMNSLETLARGAALQAAILSTNFQVANFIIEEHNALAVHLQYTFQGKSMRENEIFA